MHCSAVGNVCSSEGTSSTTDVKEAMKEIHAYCDAHCLRFMHLPEEDKRYAAYE
jgi:hypothetical protein